MRDHLEELVANLLDAHVSEHDGELDIVADVAYPLPVTVLCELLGAGHETTVNLITNGMLTLLCHPDVPDRLRDERDLAIPLVEEVLRYEPPVQTKPVAGHAALSRAGMTGHGFLRSRAGPAT